MGFTPMSQSVTTTGNLDEYAQIVSNLNSSLTAAFQGVLIYEGGITTAADFPTLGAVQTGWMYSILADVTDNNAAKTNTGLSFKAGDEVVWSGATWMDSNLPLPSGVVFGPASATDGVVATFDSTSGKLLKNSSVTTASIVTGPASAIGNNLAGFNSTTGKIVLDSGIAAANVVQGPASAVGDNLTSYNSTTGKLVKDSGIAAGGVVSGPASAVGDNITSFNSTTGKLIKDSGVAVAGVVVGPASAVGDNLTSYNSTTGKLIKDSGIAAANVVQGPASAVGNNLVGFNSTTGKLIQDAGIAASNVVQGPASAVGNNLVGFNSTTGKLIQDSSITAASVTTGAVNAVNNATFTIATQVGTTINVGVQLKDSTGTSVTGVAVMLVYLSDSSNGNELVGTPPTGGTVIGTDGVLVPVLANKMFQIITNTSGHFDLNLTDSGTPSFYMVVVGANGKVLVSSAITFA